MRSKALLTGGSGLLALNWAITRRKKNDIFLGIHKHNVHMNGVSAGYIKLDSVDQVTYKLEELKPDFVVNCAGLTSIEECEKNPDLAKKINIEFAVNVAKACEKLNIKFIHISTDHLFSGEHSLLDENAHPNPVNVYGKTKAEAEDRIITSNQNALIIRTNFYGWGTTFRKSFSDFIINSLRSGKQITLFEDIFYTPILIENVANVTHELIAKGLHGIYHVTGDQRVSKLQFGLELCREFGLDSSLIRPGLIGDDQSLVTRPKDMSLDNRKASNAIGGEIGGIVQHISRLNIQEKINLQLELLQI
jgi:dTDP-4-dehydrorhamnose reductase